MIKELFKFKYFLAQLVKKHIVNQYKQTIMGPFLQLLNPMLQSGLFAIVFGKILKINTGDVSSFFYYLITVTLFNFYRTATLKSSIIFTSFAALFKSFYFPKILIPFSIILESLILYFFQFLILVLVLLFFSSNEIILNPINIMFTFLPLLLSAIIALASGMIFSSLTFKYRDLISFTGYILQGIFFLTPVIYSTSSVDKDYLWLFHFNPMYYPIAYYKYLFLNSDYPDINYLYSCIFFTTLLVIIAFKLFSYADKKFDDFN
jgi:lipopolysaccharide transport system permease protein